MSKDIKELEPRFRNAVLDKSKIDGWLRGISDIVPRSTLLEAGAVEAQPTPGIEVVEHNFNSHTTMDEALRALTPADIEATVGFRQLLAACKKNKVRVDIDFLGHGALEVAFTPDEDFSKSRVFGASYVNVLPVLFGAKPVGA
jgi:hypothetical protein